MRHWHGVVTGWNLAKREYFDSDRMKRDRQQKPDVVLWTPEEVADWGMAERLKLITSSPDPAAAAKRSGLDTAEARESAWHWGRTVASWDSGDSLCLQHYGEETIYTISAYVTEASCHRQ